MAAKWMQRVRAAAMNEIHADAIALPFPFCALQCASLVCALPVVIKSAAWHFYIQLKRPELNFTLHCNFFSSTHFFVGFRFLSFPFVAFLPALT